MIDSLLKKAYRWLLSLSGRYWLEKAFNDGLSERLRSPLLFLLTKRLSESERLVSDKVEALRSRMTMRENAEISIYSHNPIVREAASTQAVQLLPAQVKKVALTEIATTTSVLPYWGIFLYLCANANKAQTILELGGCAGISGCYMASSWYCNSFITIEGSRELATLAESNLSQVAGNFRVVNAEFDDGLDKILTKLSDKLDMVYIDGHHQKLPTIRYFKRIIPYLNPGCIVVFDDIHWSSDMLSAWQILSSWQGVSHALNLGRFGICVWDGGTDSPRSYNFSLFTDLWKKGNVKT